MTAGAGPTEPASRPQAPDSESRLRKVAQGLVKLTATVAVTYFIFRRLGVTLEEVQGVSLTAFDPNWALVVASLGLLLAGHFVAGVLWAKMAQDLGGRSLRPWQAFQIFMAANLGRYLPGKVWQILGLAYLAKRAGTAAGPATASAVLGHLLALAATAALAVPAFSNRFDTSGWLLLAGAATAYLGLASAAFAGWSRRLLRRVFSRSDSLTSVIDHVQGRFGLRWSLRFLAVWVVYSAAFALFVKSLEPNLGLFAAGSAFAAAYLLGYVFLLAPAGIGIREGVLSSLLAGFMGAQQAIAIAVLARLWTTVGELLPAALVAPGLLKESQQSPAED